MFPWGCFGPPSPGAPAMRPGKAPPPKGRVLPTRTSPPGRGPNKRCGERKDYVAPRNNTNTEERSVRVISPRSSRVGMTQPAAAAGRNVTGCRRLWPRREREVTQRHFVGRRFRTRAKGTVFGCCLLLLRIRGANCVDSDASFAHCESCCCCLSTPKFPGEDPRPPTHLVSPLVAHWRLA